MMKKFKVLLALSVLGLFGCAKSPEYETVYKSPKLASIADTFDTGAEYLYVPMTLGAPREIPDADPFFQGIPKIVKIRFVEKGLEVISLDSEDPAGNNPTNIKPILLIPGSYHSYKCAENSIGECTNKEEENDRLEWNQKAYFYPSLEDTQVIEVNSIQVFNIEGNPCVDHIGTKLVDYSIEKGLINFELEKTFQTVNTPSCVNKLLRKGSLDYASFNVRFYYSLVKLDNVVSPSYVKVSYPERDRNTFGFFSEGKEIKNDNVHRNRYGAEFLLKRFNPNKKVITYHLSDSFSKPENKIEKEATYKSIDSINQSLKMANAGITIKLEEPSGKNPGDIRYSMINLIDESRESGLLGYGPMVNNPRTGETIRGIVNIYSGVLKSNIRGIWNSMVSITKKRSNVSVSPETVTTPVTTDTPASVSLRNENTFSSVENFYAARENFVLNPSTLNLVVNKFSTIPNKELAFSKNLKDLYKKEEDRLIRFSENNAYAEEFLNMDSAAKKLYPGMEKFPAEFYNDGEKVVLKAWDNLDQDQKKYAQDFILPYLFSTTLVHELGHNLGLRHNFMGSYDKNNFYSHEEAHEVGLSSTPEYSSIMDYSGNELEDAQAFGKYDIAALRFAYAREVETSDNKFVKINTTLKDLTSSGVTLKSYLYCTDENESTSIKCNKFDEGTSVLEITKNIIERYEDSYEFLNFRDGRNDYATDFMDSYLFARYMTFRQLRAVFEEWEKDERFPENIKTMGCLGMTVNHPLFKESCIDLEDKLAAANLAGQFFVNILKTPDRTCAFARAETPNITELHSPLSMIFQKDLGNANSLYSSCFDPRIKKIAEGQGFVIRGEVGKFLNHQIELDERYNLSTDRSAFGIWIDKLLAAKFLTQRYNEIPGSKGVSNFSSLPKVRTALDDFYFHLSTGKPLKQPVMFKNEKGEEYIDNKPYTLTFNESINTSDISDSFLNEYFSIPKAGINSIQKSVLTNLMNWELENTDNQLTDAIENSSLISLKKRYYDDTPLMSDKFRVLPLKDYYIYADEKNALAFSMIGRMLMFEQMKKAGMDKVKKVYEALTQPPYLLEMSDKEKELVNLGLMPLKGLANLKTRRPNETPATLEKILKAQGINKENLKKILKAFKENTAEEMSAVVSKMEEYNKTLDSLPEDEKQLSLQETSDLEGFLKGTYKQEMEKISEVLFYLPEFPKNQK